MPFRVPAVLRDFYFHLDTLQVRWIHHRHPEYDPALYVHRESYVDPYYVWDDELTHSGCISILPFQDVFYTDWMERHFRKHAEVQKRILFDGTYLNAHDFYARIYPFDLFHWKYASALYVDEARDELCVLHAFDGFADFQHSIITDLESYLELILQTLGLVSSRLHYFSPGSSKANVKRFQPPPSFWTSWNVPNLDQMNEHEW